MAGGFKQFLLRETWLILRWAWLWGPRSREW